METETQGAGTRVRGWLLAVLGVALVALVAYQMWPEQSAAPALGASNRQAANRRTGAARSGAARGEIDPAELKVRLEALQAKAPDFDKDERNPFRFQPPPAPPPPPLKPVATDRAGRTTAAASAATDSADPPEVHGNGREARFDAGGIDRLQGVFVRGPRG